MADLTRGQAAAVRLHALIEEIAAEVDRLPPALITWIPGDGVWTVMDILCHIREFVPYWTRETLRIVERPGDQWGRDHTDAGRLAAVANTAGFNLAAVVADIRESVKRSAEALTGLLLVQHVEKHLGQIRRNVTQYNAAERPA
jgi:hypothetical protein